MRGANIQVAVVYQATLMHFNLMEWASLLHKTTSLSQEIARQLLLKIVENIFMYLIILHCVGENSIIHAKYKAGCKFCLLNVEC